MLALGFRVLLVFGYLSASRHGLYLLAARARSSHDPLRKVLVQVLSLTVPESPYSTAPGKAPMAAPLRFRSSFDLVVVRAAGGPLSTPHLEAALDPKDLAR